MAYLLSTPSSPSKEQPGLTVQHPLCERAVGGDAAADRSSAHLLL